MAGNNGSLVDSESASSPSLSCNEGPVLNMMNKRLRALKKKFNRIIQIEENKAQGKNINKEQEEVLRSKTAVAALIDEYEKLRKPLAMAVQEEIAEREKELQNATSNAIQEDNEKEEDASAIPAAAESEDREVCIQETSPQEANEISDVVVEPQHETSVAPALSDSAAQQIGSMSGAGAETATEDDVRIADLLTLIYFAQLFDVRSPSEVSPLIWKVHERSSCLSYDCVTEDSPSPLSENDLDYLSLMGLMMTSRPPNVTLSHKDSLQQCLKHAKHWLQNSDAFIGDDIGLTYSHLRERLNRILSSEYFTMTPEIKYVCQPEAVTAATATLQYAPQLIISDESTIMELKNAPAYFSPQF